MVERVTNTPQVGGQNLDELVTSRQSKHDLIKSVSGPPATSVARTTPSPDVPSAPEESAPDPVQTPSPAEQTNELISRARQRRQQLEAASPNVRKAAQSPDTSAQVRQLVGQALENFSTGGNLPAPATESTAQQAGVVAVPDAPERAPAGPEISPAAEAPEATGGGVSIEVGAGVEVDVPSDLERPGAPAGNQIETERQVQTTQAPQATGEAVPEPVAQVGGAAPVGGVVETGAEAPVEAVPDTPEPAGGGGGDEGTTDTSGSRGEVVNVVA